MPRMKCLCSICKNENQGRGIRPPKPVPFRFVFGVLVVFGVLYEVLQLIRGY